MVCLRAAQRRRSLSRSLRVRENDIDPETLGPQLRELAEEELTVATMKKIGLPASLTVRELAERLGVTGTQLITYLMQNGVAAALNQSIDFDTAALAADHFGFEAESEEAAAREAAAGASASGALRRRHPLLDLSGEDPSALVARPPVVAVLGHVDHGKTSILDRVRATSVAAGEAGGITQRIGAYQVERQGRLITFIDTPGHAAFTAMRARGADVTDIAVLVVAADDGVMPQTDEAIHHIRSAGVPLIVAVNKVDKDGANPERVLQQLAEHEVVPESYGGDVPVVNTSALTGQGIEDLLDTILLVSDVVNPPRANPNRLAVGTVIDSELERGRGPVATVLVQNGTLRIGDNVVVGRGLRQGEGAHRRRRPPGQGGRPEQAGPDHRPHRRRHRRRHPPGDRDRAGGAGARRAARGRSAGTGRPAGAPDHPLRLRGGAGRDQDHDPGPQGRGQRLPRGPAQPGHQARGPQRHDQDRRRGGRGGWGGRTSTSPRSPAPS